jgi:four helix bundle protein
MKTPNPIVEKSFAFACRIVKLYKYLCEQKEFELSKQIVRSGTSIGANVEEAIGGQSKKDFLSKISIAYKEARETIYWLRLLSANGYLDEKSANSLTVDANELCKILGSIQLTVKTRNTPLMTDNS